MIAVPGEEKILAAMVFDPGEGVRVFDPETLMNEPERLLHRQAADKDGKYTLWYCFGEFLEGGQSDLRGQIMVSVCRDISIGWGEALLNYKYFFRKKVLRNGNFGVY